MDELTPRQLKIAELIAHGFKNKEIAKSLGLSVPCLRNQVQAIYHQLGMSSEIGDQGNRVRLAVLYAKWFLMPDCAPGAGTVLAQTYFRPGEGWLR